ncbi:MAG: hypothetical protein LJE68_15320 [Rhodobacter sp.]|jgi:hypothetical protein|nr:hypothetical protein [Rhodobacter sp.]
MSIKFGRSLTIVAVLVAFTGVTGVASAGPVAIKIETGGTIKVGDYETVCDKKPESCGSELDPTTRPKPKPKPKPATLANFGSFSHLSTGYMMFRANR